MKQARIVFSTAVIILLISSCAPQIQPIPTVTSNPTEMPTATIPTPTATVSPTSTPRPTPTITPIPDWVTNFTEPILKAIANRPPTYQDDFSDPRSGWYVGTTSGHPDVLIDGKKEYFEGEYRVVTNGITSEDPSVCSGHEDRHVGRYGDFVAEFDIRFVSGKDGDWQIQFHRNDIGQYTLTMNISWNNVGFTKCSPQTGPACGGIATYAGDQVHRGFERNRILLIVRGARMAAYANGAPILYLEDKTYTDEFGKGYFSLSSCNAGDMPIEIRWDNFKVWDISNLP